MKTFFMIMLLLVLSACATDDGDTSSIPPTPTPTTVQDQVLEITKNGSPSLRGCWKQSHPTPRPRQGSVSTCRVAGGEAPDRKWLDHSRFPPKGRRAQKMLLITTAIT